MSSNKIHSTCIIDERVEIGANNEILPNTIIYGPTKIGDNNIIGPNVVIGTPGQDTKKPRYDSSNSYIEIGNNNIIRESTAVQKPCYKDITILGNDIYLMHCVHISHDSIIYDKVSIAPMSVLAGITTLLTGASLGMGVTVHQYSVIGHYSMIAMGSAVVKNIKPFTVYVPNKPARVNYYALKKFGFEEFAEDIESYIKEDIIPSNHKIANIIEEFEKLHKDSKRPIYK